MIVCSIASLDHGVAAHLPPDPTWIGTVYRSINSGGTGFKVSVGAFIGVGADENAGCC
jgi:hypothetical protein